VGYSHPAGRKQKKAEEEEEEERGENKLPKHPKLDIDPV